MGARRKKKAIMGSIAKPGFLILGCGPIGGILASFIADNCKKIGMVDANEAHFQKIHKDGLKTIIGYVYVIVSCCNKLRTFLKNRPPRSKWRKTL